jgi:hypothetical protein
LNRLNDCWRQRLPWIFNGQFGYHAVLVVTAAATDSAGYHAEAEPMQPDPMMKRGRG